MTKENVWRVYFLSALRYFNVSIFKLLLKKSLYFLMNIVKYSMVKVLVVIIIASIS